MFQNILLGVEPPSGIVLETPLVMTTEEQVADFIAEKVNSYQSITGARLGTLVSAQFPGFQARYGKLRPFVQRFCQGIVKIVTNVGKDDIYAPFSAPNKCADATKPSEPVETVWRSFTTPGVSGMLCVNCESGELRVRPKEEPSASAPWADVPPVSLDEHRQVASDFLPEIAEEDRDTFQQILQLPAFWPPWAARTRDAAGGKYSKAWQLFRFNKLCELYLLRLKSLGFGDELAKVSLGRLKELKSASRRVCLPPIPWSPDSSRGAASLRRIARAALDALSEEELRRVWLPLGLVADATRNHHSE